MNVTLINENCLPNMITKTVDSSVMPDFTSGYGLADYPGGCIRADR